MTSQSAPDTSDREYQVTPLELFFDLVFVFGVSQLSHHLLTDLSWRGAVETLVMLFAIYAVWFSTSWSATIVRVDRSRTRWLVLSVMVLGLFMNASVTRAFTTSGWAFVVPLLAIQLGRLVWMIVNAGTRLLRGHYVRMLVWVVVTTPLWIIGAAAGKEQRLLWWVAAAGVDAIGRALAHPIPGRRLQSENVEFDASHMLERCRLFLIIALGETVFTTGAAIASAPTSRVTLVTGAAALTGTVALWALSFGRSHRLILRHVEETRDPILTSRHAADALMIMVAGLVAVAVGNEMVIAHPHGPTEPALSLLLAGGPLLFLAAQGWYLRAVLRTGSRLQVAGVILLVLVGLALLAVPRDVALILVGATITLLAVAENVSKGAVA